MSHHQFAPEVYHNTIGSNEPVMHIANGDTVSTTTIDAFGFNAENKQVGKRPNPMTGPFYIEGAEIGDSLAITFDKVYPNRRKAWTRRAIAPNILDPGYHPQFEDEIKIMDWEIDFDKDTVRPIDIDPPLSNLSIPLRPMLGCFGVAPPNGQAISTATSSTHGGNMDYNGFVQGVTVYFPVEAQGALFHLGDGHAVQGDGEIVGTGLEVSFDVTFTVRLQKGKTIKWPRAKNKTHIMTVGNARPLDQCVEHATTEMVRWLEEDYSLSTRSAHILMGQVVEYDMGNVYDPAYTMICKMSKQVLDSLGVKKS